MKNNFVLYLALLGFVIPCTLESQEKYGNYILQYNSGEYSKSIIRDDSLKVDLIEVFPGIIIHKLHWSSTPGYFPNLDRVEYYNTETKKLIKRVDLEKISPYKIENHDTISIGVLTYDYMEPPKIDSNCHILGILPPASYCLNSNWLRSVSANGFICISLVNACLSSNDKIVSWEQTFKVFDNTGVEIGSYNFDHSAYSPLITNDDRYLCYSFGKGTAFDNPFEPCIPVFEIIDLKEGKKIFSFEGGRDMQIGKSVEHPEGIITHKFFSNNGNSIEHLSLNLKERTASLYEYTKEDFRKYLSHEKDADFQDYLKEQTVKHFNF